MLGGFTRSKTQAPRNALNLIGPWYLRAKTKKCNDPSGGKGGILIFRGVGKPKSHVQVIVNALRQKGAAFELEVFKIVCAHFSLI